mmetsp:Transcript_10506/g.19274  ORF Transcript_10506/g.19274 Transcript_10506/m.19274 type:complete len:416 (-) Transcript_10506:291-1538(-)
MSALNNYINALKQAISQKDVKQVQTLLSPRSQASVALIMHHTALSRSAPLPTAADFSRLPDPWSTAAFSFISAALAEQRGEYAVSQRDWKVLVQTLTRYLESSRDKTRENDWMVPLASAAAAQLKHACELADDEAVRTGRAPELLNDGVAALQALFKQLSTSKSSTIRQSESVGVACVIAKAYFKLNTFNNCETLFKVIDDMELTAGASIAHRATLCYYEGRSRAYDEKFVAAEAGLSEAFQLCGAIGHHRNLERVLRYLIPVRLLLGVLPSPQLLRRFRLEGVYGDICRAVREGDLALLAQALARNQILFIRQGTYLILERLQAVVQRTLLRKCFLRHRSEVESPQAAAQVPMKLFEAALVQQGVVEDPLEVQCILVNLISRKLVKAYLAPQKQIIVLKISEPFPPLAQVYGNR